MQIKKIKKITPSLSESLRVKIMNVPYKVNGLKMQSITQGLSFMRLKANPGDWQHLLLGKHPNDVEFPMGAHYYASSTAYFEKEFNVLLWNNNIKDIFILNHNELFLSCRLGRWRAE